MRTKITNAAANTFTSGRRTEFFGPMSRIAHLHSFVLSKGKNKLTAYAGPESQRSDTVNVPVNANYGGNIWYGTSQYPDIG